MSQSERLLYVDMAEDYHVSEKPMFGKDGARMSRKRKPTDIDKGYNMCEVPDFMRSNSMIVNDFPPMIEMDLLHLTRNANNDSATYGRHRIDRGELERQLI